MVQGGGCHQGAAKPQACPRRVPPQTRRHLQPPLWACGLPPSDGQQGPSLCCLLNAGLRVLPQIGPTAKSSSRGHLWTILELWLLYEHSFFFFFTSTKLICGKLFWKAAVALKTRHDAYLEYLRFSVTLKQQLAADRANVTLFNGSITVM